MKNDTWYYDEEGSINKKTGKPSMYKVKVTDWNIVDCDCKAREFRRYSPCKHMKGLKQRLGYLNI